MKDIKAEASKSRSAKLQRYGASKKHADEQEDRKLFKKMYDEAEAKEPADEADMPKRAMGGRVDGNMPSSRLDRAGRKGKPNTNINIIIQGKGDAAPADPGAPPMGMKPPMPPMPPMPPPGAGPGEPPPGMPPMPMPNMPMRKNGGRVGSGSALGRLMKAK